MAGGLQGSLQAKHLADANMTRGECCFYLAAQASRPEGHGTVQVEGIELTEDSLTALGEVGGNTSLRHAVQLLTPASVLARSDGRDKISTTHVDEVARLFRDAKFSARLLAEQADKYIS